MSDFDLIVEEKLKKLRTGRFGIDDLSGHLKKRSKPGAKVTPLRERKWTKVGKYWVFLRKTYGGLDDSWIEVLVVKQVGFICELLTDKPVAVVEWNTVPQTNLAFEMWFVGDSVNSVALLVEVVDSDESGDN